MFSCISGSFSSHLGSSSGSFTKNYSMILCLQQKAAWLNSWKTFLSFFPINTFFKTEMMQLFTKEFGRTYLELNGKKTCTHRLFAQLITAKSYSKRPRLYGLDAISWLYMTWRINQKNKSWKRIVLTTQPRFFTSSYQMCSNMSVRKNRW